MELQQIEGHFTICKVSSLEKIDFTQDYVFLAKTPDEYSLVCRSVAIPLNATEFKAGWKALRVAGKLSFDLVGIIADISEILAEEEISIFVISTFDTDYILIQEADFDKAIQMLDDDDYDII